MTWKGRDIKNPKHPVTKQELVGGFDPLTVSKRPFGFRGTEYDCGCPTLIGCGGDPNCCGPLVE